MYKEPDLHESRRSSWVLPRLSWDAVTNAKARISGPLEQAPAFVRDIELHSLSRQLYAWWLELRGLRLMPGSDNIDPRQLVELMPYFRMLRWDGENELTMRIYGSALVEATGFDLTGFNIFPPGDYAGKANDIARLKMMHEQPCGLLMHRDVTGIDGVARLCEFINFPMEGTDDGRKRIVGTIVPCAPIDEADLDFTLKVPLTVRRAAFIDIGYGLPAGVDHLSC
tara:strand:- start:49784 stop:50458 length:675 start_codon:yes stop_codon:yes gene_type:complete